MADLNQRKPIVASKQDSSSGKMGITDLMSDDEFKQKQLTIDRDLLDVSKVALVFYVSIVTMTFIIADRTSPGMRDFIRPSEQTAAAAAAGACFAAALSSAARMLVLKAPIGSRSVELTVTLVHTIAGCTNLMMWGLRVPVVLNEFTGCPVYLLRWCEWTTLSFVMQFLIESIGSVHEKYSFRHCFKWAFYMQLSTVCGALFPFMPNWTSFLVVLFISCWLYFLIFPRLYELHLEVNESHDQRLRVAYQLQSTCAFTWTIFVFIWFGQWFWQALYPMTHTSLPFYTEAFVDVCAKVLYASAIEGLDQEKHETQKEAQSKTIHNLVTTIWTFCGDVFMLSKHQDKDQTTDDSKNTLSEKPPADVILSPGVKLMLGSAESNDTCSKASQSSLPRGSDSLLSLSHNLWDLSSTEYQVSDHQLCHEDGTVVNAEVGAVKHRDGGSGTWLIAVVRDVTDRVRRQEVERKLELTDLTRSKDLEASRFARHEIKNGIINSLNLLQGVNDAINEGVRDEMFSSSDFATTMLTHCRNTKGELDSTLSAVLCDAAVRDLVHDNYNARPEAINVPDFLKSLFNGAQIVYEIQPHNFPILTVDRFLIKIAASNAVSNAIKYGKANGTVRILITFKGKRLCIEFINEPGPFHEELCSMEQETVDVAFQQGARLGIHKQQGVASGHSHGDGTWIMRLCMDAMDGSCELVFHHDCTSNKLTFKAEMYIDDELSANFELPPKTYVVFIDDAAVQRKIFPMQIKKLFNVAPEYLIVRGESEAEIRAFEMEMCTLVTENPDTRIVLIVDENLDYNTDGVLGSMSGSLIVNDLRKRLRESDTPETNLLSLVRSGNDSASDEQKYLERAHGALSKSVSNKVQLKKTLAERWYGRFGVQAGPVEAANSDEMSFGFDKETADMVVEDIQATLARLEGIDDGQDIGWSSLWRALHQVKGNCSGLNSCDARPKLCAASIQVCQTISDMRGPNPPEYVHLTQVLPTELRLVVSEIEDCFKGSA